MSLKSDQLELGCSVFHIHGNVVNRFTEITVGVKDESRTLCQKTVLNVYT